MKLPLAEGTHRLELRNDHCLPYSATIEIKGGKTTVHSAALELK